MDAVKILNIERVFRDNLILLGGAGSGKTVLAKLLIKEIKELYPEVRFRIFDTSRAHNYGPIKWVYKPKVFRMLPNFPNLSVVYDLAYYNPFQRKEVIVDLLRRERHKALDREDKGEPFILIIYVFEEAQTYMTKHFLNSKKGSEVLELVSVGRNFNKRFMAITQRPQSIDNEIWERCGQRYFGKFNRSKFLEDDDILGKNWAKKTLSLKPLHYIHSIDGDFSLVEGKFYKGERVIDIMKVIKKK